MSQRNRHVQPIVENLEGRRLLASVGLQCGLLVVHGTKDADLVGIHSDGTNVTIDLNGVAKSFRLGRVHGVVVHAGKGSDWIEVGDSSINLPVMLFGGAGDDTLSGAAGNDYICGGDGADLIFAWGGNDHVHGGAGDDIMDGSDGNDCMHGGHGNDIMAGGAGDDRMRGGHGNDEMFGEDGNDHMHGGKGDDILHGGPGDDHLHGGRGNNVIDDEDEMYVG